MFLVLYVLTGALAGLLSGLLGIGGGLIFVPVLLFIFSSQGMNAEIVAQLAVGTSLAAIIPTALSAVLRHQTHGNINWPVFLKIASGMVAGSCIGITIILSMNHLVLQLSLSFFVFFTAWNMYFSGRSKAPEILQLPTDNKQYFYGFIIGWISSMFGIGGGSFTVPLLTRFGFSMKHAIGTSSACMLAISIAGSLMGTFASSSLQHINNTTGLIYWPALLSVIPSSIIFARIGSGLTERINPARLRLIFICFLILVGLRLLLGSFL